MNYIVFKTKSTFCSISCKALHRLAPFSATSFIHEYDIHNKLFLLRKHSIFPFVLLHVLSPPTAERSLMLCGPPLSAASENESTFCLPLS